MSKEGLRRHLNSSRPPPPEFDTGKCLVWLSACSRLASADAGAHTFRRSQRVPAKGVSLMIEWSSALACKCRYSETRL